MKARRRGVTLSGLSAVSLRKPAAFTLVELLVVIGIITVLVAFLFPALRKAWASAHLVQCKSNLRQVYVGVTMYGGDYKDHWPDAETLGKWAYRVQPGMLSPGDPGAVAEKFGLAAMLHGISPTESPTSAVRRRARYLPGISKVWVCPVATDAMRSYGNTYAFNINSSLASWTSLQRGRAPITPYVWDNYNFKPGKSGALGSFGGYTLPAAQQQFPHTWGNTGRGAVCELRVSGAVELRTLD